MSHREEKRAKKEEKHVLQVLAALQVKDITHETAHSERKGGWGGGTEGGRGRYSVAGVEVLAVLQIKEITHEVGLSGRGGHCMWIMKAGKGCTMRVQGVCGDGGREGPCSRTGAGCAVWRVLASA